MRPVPLYNLKQGINRLRVKGGANPSSLYDLVNAWITVDGSVDPREGTIRAQVLDATTHGLMADDGVFNVFSIVQETVPAGYVDNVLTPPTNTTETAATVFAFTAAIASVGAINASGLGSGWASGTTNSSNPFGNLTSTPNPPTFGGGNVATFSYTSTGPFNNTIVLAVSGSIASNAFDKVSYTIGGTTVSFNSADATYSTSTITGFTTWIWTVTSNPFTGGVATSVTIFTATTSTPDIATIWFAKPFMGFPYVVAQFTDGSVRHYWLQNSGDWAPNTIYFNGTLILPLTTPTGFAYLAQRTSAVNPTWVAETVISLNTIVEPTEYTGFQYKAVAVAGTSPHTGQTEPVWPIVAAATLQEFGDFDTSSTDAGTTQGSTASTAQPLSTTITDRYGDSETIASAGASSGGTLTLPAAASTTVTTWAKGTLYAPGAVVQPSTSQGGFLNAIPNGDFEAGNDGNWILSGGVAFYSGVNVYQGSEALQFSTNASNQTAVMNTFGVVTPGQSVTASCYFNPHSSGADLEMFISLNWYTSGDVFISRTSSVHQENGGYRLTTVTGTAPPTAVRCRVQLEADGAVHSARQGYADLVSWNLETPAPVSNFLFEAVQAIVGTSGSVEPTWPTIAGNTVVDNTVTWKAIGTSIITWEAIPIMQSGNVEPVWPTAVPIAVHDASTFTDLNGVVIDTSISWITSSRQITDPKCPNTIGVALNSSHVFAIDKDIVPFSAAVDPTDWSSTNNAGYLPTGLNNYGDNPAMVLALYRSNLIALNAGGYQLWQTDPDPANMALLDAQPVGSIYTRGAQSVANDLLFVTEVGVRNLATVGATANMQVGSSGQPVDPLILVQLRAGIYQPISLYYPGKGQYWVFWGPQAFVFTVNGQGLRTWSRYVFPDTITDWTLNGGILYLRTAGNLVWQLDAGTLVDDLHAGTTTLSMVAGTLFASVGYLNLGTLTGTLTPTTLFGVTIKAFASILSGGSLILDAPTGTPQNFFDSVAFTDDTHGLRTFTSASATFVDNGTFATWTWAGPIAFTSGNTYPLAFSVAATGTPFLGIIQTPYVDAGPMGYDKELIGIDLVGTGEVNVQIGWAQNDPTTFNDNPGFSTSLNVSPPYNVNASDTIPGQPIPFPMTAPSFTVILTFAGNQAWQWQASTLYLQDVQGTQTG